MRKKKVGGRVVGCKGLGSVQAQKPNSGLAVSLLRHKNFYPGQGSRQHKK